MRKKILILLVVLTLIAGVLSLLFSSSKYQVGDYIYEGKYFDTAYDAFVDSGGCSEYELDEELATIKVTNDFAVWIASTKTHEFMLVKMSLKNNQYCSLDDYYIISITNCNDPELVRSFTLGESGSLLYTICSPTESSNNDAMTESFYYKGKKYLFLYEIIDS